MKTLTPEAFSHARDFIYAHARPLDRALYQYHFEGAPAELVLSELAVFQNENGGFGKALEPDLRTPSSSALATEHALEILIELGTPSDHPMILDTVHYLLDTFDHSAMTWRVAPLDTKDYPHAPWWHDDNGSLRRTFGDFLIIPRAKLVGFLYPYVEHIPAQWLAELTEATVEAIESDTDLGSGGGDDLGHALSLAETKTFPVSFRERLVRRLIVVVPQAVSRSPEEWRTYSREPLKIAPSPDSMAAAWLEDILPTNLDFRIESQVEDGAWDPTWTWYGAYPEVWEQAKQEWRGVITLRTLLSLRAYGRM